MKFYFITFLIFLQILLFANPGYKYLTNDSIKPVDRVKRFLEDCQKFEFFELPIEKKQELLKRSIVLSSKLEEKKYYVQLLYRYAAFNRSIGDFNKVESLVDSVIILSEKWNIKKTRSSGYMLLCLIEGRRGNFEAALQAGKSALRISESEEYLYGQIEAHDGIAAVYQRLGKIYLSLKHLLASLTIAKTLNNYSELSNINTRIGAVYLTIRETEKALIHRKEAVEYAELSGDSLYIATAKHRLGDVYRKLGDYEKAMPLYQDAITIRKKTNRKDRYAQVILSAAILKIEQKDFDSAINYLKDATENFISLKHEQGAAVSYKFMGDAYLSKAMLDSAESAYQHALSLINNEKRFKLYSEIYLGLSKIEQQNKNFEKAFEYLQHHKSAFDSLQFAEQKRLTAYNEAKYEFELEKNRQAENFQSVIGSKEEEIKLRNYLIIGVVIFSLSITLLSVLLFRSSRNQKKSLAIIKKQNADIHQKNESLKELDKIKNNYFTILAHDLRTPFGTILQLSEVLNKYSSEKNLSRIREAADLLENSSKHFNELLEQTLEWGRLQMEGIKLNKEIFELSAQVEKTMELLNFSAEAKQIRITNKIPTGIQVISDRDIFHGVLSNLVTNSIKFTQRDGSITIYATEFNDSKVRVSVKDDGVGINKNKITDLFIPGESINSPGTEGESGTGFGLINSKKMIELDGGELTIESRKGEGTTVHFTLDLVINSADQNNQFRGTMHKN